MLTAIMASTVGEYLRDNVDRRDDDDNPHHHKNGRTGIAGCGRPVREFIRQSCTSWWPVCYRMRVNHAGQRWRRYCRTADWR